MNIQRTLGLVLALAFVKPVVAHHSFAAEFDANKMVTLQGAVTKVEWANPHIWIYLEVKDDKGGVRGRCAKHAAAQRGGADVRKGGGHAHHGGRAGEGRLEEVQRARGHAPRGPRGFRGFSRGPHPPPPETVAAMTCRAAAIAAM